MVGLSVAQHYAAPYLQGTLVIIFLTRLQVSFCWFRRVVLTARLSQGLRLKFVAHA